MNEVALMPMTSMAMMIIIALSSTSTSELRKVRSEGSASFFSNALTMALRSNLASFMPSQRIRMAMSSLGMKATVSCVSSWRPSRMRVFSPVTTALMSVRFMFLRLSVMARVMLSEAWRFWLNSSEGGGGRVPSFCAAAKVIRVGVLSSNNNMVFFDLSVQKYNIYFKERKKRCIFAISNRL